jgi:hypothetical protein
MRNLILGSGLTLLAITSSVPVQAEKPPSAAGKVTLHETKLGDDSIKPGLKLKVPDQKKPSTESPGLKLKVPDQKKPSTESPGLKLKVPDQKKPSTGSPDLKLKVTDQKKPITDSKVIKHK